MNKLIIAAILIILALVYFSDVYMEPEVPLKPGRTHVDYIANTGEDYDVNGNFNSGDDFNVDMIGGG